MISVRFIERRFTLCCGTMCLVQYSESFKCADLQDLFRTNLVILKNR